MIGRSGDPGDALSLALRARKAIKSLMAIESNAPTNSEALQKAGQNIVDTLQAFRSNGLLFAYLTAPQSFCEKYEQIQILDEVRAEIGDESYGAKLISATSPDSDPTARAANIDFAIEFFTAVESRALLKYNQAPSSHF